MMNNYLFTSKRLGFRAWQDDDLPVLRAMNTDPEVMKYFPSTKTKEQDIDLLKRLQRQYKDHGYTYYAVEILSSKESIGFIGIAYQTYESPYTPFVDIGWRLLQKNWGQGYATEGAKKVLDYASRELDLNEIFSVASEINTPSINVMKKIGMSYVGTFKHTLLSDYPKIESCVAYKISLT